VSELRTFCFSEDGKHDLRPVRRSVASECDRVAQSDGKAPGAVAAFRHLRFSARDPAVWFVASALFIGAFGWFFEEVLGWSKEENSWLVKAAAICTIGLGFVLWRLIGMIIDSQWGRSRSSTT
jgi:hypothetical protein